jgi:hypothetical protein
MWTNLDPSSQATLELLRDGKDATESQKKDLARDFNRLMALSDFYDETRFADVKLRPETKDLLEKLVSQKGEERLYLSRLLLEDAFPKELSREREHAKEAADLQEKQPASRVLVVGDSVKMPKDVTEPIQWLMR